MDLVYARLALFIKLNLRLSGLDEVHVSSDISGEIMELGALSTINDSAYRAVVMLIQGVTLIAGIASILFLAACVVSAACTFIQDMTRPLRRWMKPGSTPDTQVIPGGPNAEKESQPRLLPRGVLILGLGPLPDLRPEPNHLRSWQAPSRII